MRKIKRRERKGMEFGDEFGDMGLGVGNGKLSGQERRSKQKGDQMRLRLKKRERDDRLCTLESLSKGSARPTVEGYFSAPQPAEINTRNPSKV
jgi:hypothetical protein